MSGQLTGEKPMNKQEHLLISKALSILGKQFTNNTHISDSSSMKNYLCLEFAHEWREVFAVVFLRKNHSMIICKKLFYGTLDNVSIHPRIIAKEALLLDAAAVILCHNHPSGATQPSQADISITKKIQEALDLFDIPVLDHVIVSHNQTDSFAELGLI